MQTDDNFDDAYYSALHQCGERYREMIMARWDWSEDGMPTDTKALLDFVEEFTDGSRTRLPLLKLNRWLGYIQGCLIERIYTTVEEERDWTRPLFRPLDFANV
jgi:hypothetical protein